MFNVGGGELLLILLVALLVLGPDKLPDFSRKVGRAMSEVRRLSDGFQREMRQAMDVDPKATTSPGPRLVPPPDADQPAVAVGTDASTDTDSDTAATGGGSGDADAATSAAAGPAEIPSASASDPTPPVTSDEASAEDHHGTASSGSSAA